MTDHAASQETGRGTRAPTAFRYLLNAMEFAAQQANPAKHEYATKRLAVLTHVSELESALSALREENERLRTDAERLDWIEAKLKDEPAGTDIVFAHDWEDGIWLSLVERGDYRGALAIDAEVQPLLDVRAAIDAARAAAPLRDTK